MSTSDTSYTEEDVMRLGDALDTIDLQNGERAALEALISFAARKPSEIQALTGQPGAQLKTVLAQILFDLEPSETPATPR